MITLKQFVGCVAVAMTAAALCSCSKKPQPVKPEPGTDGGEDIEVIDGKVRFYVSIDEDSPRAKMGITSRLSKVAVNGKNYTLSKSDDGRQYVEVDESKDGTYTAIYTNTLSSAFCESSANIGVKIPHSQFYKTTTTSLRDFPMYGAYSEETGNKLVFKDGFALLDLTLEGDASISSVNIKNVAGGMMAGNANFKPSTGQLALMKGVPFVELNCTSEGANVPLGASAVHFYAMLAPGNYSKGLLITVCDASHRMMQFTTGPVSVAGNDVVEIKKEYKPEDNLLYYEGFDCFVWGGDYMGGEGAIGFSPSADALTWESGADLTGYENAYSLVEYDRSGSGYIQSNTWDECKSSYEKIQTVGTSHRYTDSYVKSRGMEDFTYLFRTQERPGYVEVGAYSTSRGIIQTAMARNVEGIINADFEFDVCFRHDFADGLQINVTNGGYASDVTIDGKPVDMSAHGTGIRFLATSSKVSIPLSQLTIDKSATSKKTWSHVKVSLDRATSGTMVYIAAASSSEGKHGFFVDNIKLVKKADMPRGTLRVMDFNIQNGMWADQHNNYDNFVAWVKKYDPDICVWCESVTIYNDKTGTGIGNSGSNYKGFLPAGWAALASRYGHKYVAIGGSRDNYPQVVTSRYPISTLETITTGESSSKPIAHGAGLHSIDVNGRTIYVATLHTWPQSYGYGVKTADRDASAANYEGDKYREYEMSYVLGRTKNASKYSSQQDWLFMGDFNSRSRLDKWYMDEIGTSYNAATVFLCQDAILNNTDYQDIIAKRYPGEFMSSTAGNSRIDYMYASPSMYKDVKNAVMLIDDWTTIERSLWYTSFMNPSDHRPVMVDFEW
jgi:Endonuclease/Exonuclease/phosphatase family.